ncbi:MAG TPA: YqgE/AlgH family protein [Rhizobiaceae bacterium]|nr:YqgE/AlgH family protein [Rhizobiaceae bacterium]
MDMLKRRRRSRTGQFEGHFLVAMPGMRDPRFERTVIYICAHNDEGAMGFIINDSQSITFPELLVQTGIVDDKEQIKLPAAARLLPVRRGGPVDESRGFVLHSQDYHSGATLPVSEQICLTSTVDILRAISQGRGPKKAMMALGYSGWGAGQLESEIANNGWLTCPANPDLVFDIDDETKYDRIFRMMGISPGSLSSEVGHA